MYIQRVCLSWLSNIENAKEAIKLHSKNLWTNLTSKLPCVLIMSVPYLFYNSFTVTLYIFCGHRLFVVLCSVTYSKKVLVSLIKPSNKTQTLIWLWKNLRYRICNLQRSNNSIYHFYNASKFLHLHCSSVRCTILNSLVCSYFGWHCWNR